MSTISHSSGEKVLSPSHLAHFVLRTNNYKPMVDFYRTFLGARVRFSNEGMSLLSYDEEHHRIGIMNLPKIGAKNPSTSGLEHVAFTFDSLEKLTQAWQQRKEHGIVPFWCTNHGITISIYYRDPDGNTIETQVDTMTADEADEYLLSADFQTNPIGVDFDPEDLVRRLEAGEDRASIVKRPASGPRGPDSVPGFVFE